MPWFCSSSMAFSSTGTTGELCQMRALAPIFMECGRSDLYDNWGGEATGVADTVANNRLGIPLTLVII